MCRAELFDIDDGSGPQAINLGGQLTGQVALLAMELVYGLGNFSDTSRRTPPYVGFGEVHVETKKE